jgi:hypothetical protein
VSKRTVESKRAALLAEQRMLLEEQATLRVTPSWDTKAHSAFVARLTKYEKRFRAFLRGLASAG